MTTLTRNPSADWTLTPTDLPNMPPSTPVPSTAESKSRSLALQAAAKGTVSPPASSPNSCASEEDVAMNGEGSPAGGSGGKKRKAEAMLNMKATEGQVINALEKHESLVDLTMSSPITAKTAKRPKTESKKQPNAKASSSKSGSGSTKKQTDKGEKKKSTEGKVNGKEKKTEAEGKKGKGQSDDPLIELKPKKLSLNQKPFSPTLSKYKQFVELKEAFQVWMKQQDAEEVITEFPKEFWGLIVMGGMESSDTTPKKLAESLKTLLIDESLDTGDSEIAELSNKAITTVISLLLVQEACGFHASDFVADLGESSSAAAADQNQLKIPDAYAILRWEVVDEELIPTENKIREKMIKRRAMRVRARQEASSLARTLTDQQLTEVLGEDASLVQRGTGVTSAINGTAMDLDLPETTSAAPIEQPPQSPYGEEIPEESEKVARSRAESEAASTTSSAAPENGKRVGRTKKEETEEQKEKRLAKEQRKEAKLQAEVKAADEKAKSAALMQSFFVKPKAPSSAATASATSGCAIAGPSSPVKRDREVARRDRSSSRSDGSEQNRPGYDFKQTFRDFVIKSNTVRARENHFAVSDIDQADMGIEIDVQSGSDPLQDFLAASRRQAKPPRSVRSGTALAAGPSLKTEVLYMTIPELLIKGQEADDPRSVYAHLRDGRKFPMKTLKFHEDSRPAYHGTWAKSAASVGPRTPFAMDPVLDYSIDEGPDWEAPEGDDQELGDGLNDNASEKSESESSEDDLDGWLCDDDEIEMMEGFDPGYNAGVHPADVDEGFSTPAASRGKGKGKGKDKIEIEQDAREKPKKGEPHRKVEKLVQFQCGPIWEDVIGEETAQKAYKGFEQYQIRLLNDTPSVGIDPWLWQSADVKATAVALAVEPISVPAFVDQVTSGATKSAVTGTMGPPAARVRAPSVKSQFPDALLPAFLQVIKGSEKTAAELLREIYAKFEGKATKVAMKAKFEAVATRKGTRSGPWSVESTAETNDEVTSSKVA